MKKLVSFITILSILGCDSIDNREITAEYGKIQVNSTVDNKTPEIFFNETGKISFKYEPEMIPTEAKYMMEFNTIGGEGTITYNGVAYNANSPFEITDLTGEFLFNPTKWIKNDVSIQFTLTDKDGATIKNTSNIVVKQRPMKFTSTASNSKTVLIGKEEKGGIINNTLTVEGSWAGISYILKPVISGGNGYFIYNGNEYKNSEEISITPSNFNLEYKPTEFGTGNHQISLEVTSGDAQTTNTTVSFDVYQNPILVEGEVVKTGRTKGGKYGCANGCNYETDYGLILPEIIVNDGAEIEDIIIEINGEVLEPIKWKQFISSTNTLRNASGKNLAYRRFYGENKEPEDMKNWNNKDITITIVDSNGKKGIIYKGTFTYNLDDNQ